MNRRSLLVFGRVIFAALGALSTLVAVQGALWATGGSQMFHSPPTSGEDLTQLSGAALEIIGIPLALFGSLFAILFVGLFQMLGKKLKPAGLSKH